MRGLPFPKVLENEYERKELIPSSTNYSFTLDPGSQIKPGIVEGRKSSVRDLSGLWSQPGAVGPLLCSLA